MLKLRRYRKWSEWSGTTRTGSLWFGHLQTKFSKSQSDQSASVGKRPKFRCFFFFTNYKVIEVLGTTKNVLFITNRDKCKTMCE